MLGNAQSMYYSIHGETTDSPEDLEEYAGLRCPAGGNYTMTDDPYVWVCDIPEHSRILLQLEP
jgi:hypothetical protein